MAPSAKTLQEALISGTYDVFLAEPDATSVNKVRKHVEEKLGLDDGFFAGADWKQKSKTIIKEYVEKALDGWVPETKTEPDPKSAVKRPSSDAESPEPKRRKRATKPKKTPKKEESDASELSEEETKPKKKTAPRERKSKVIDPGLSEEDVKPTKKAAPKTRKAKALDSDEEVPDIKSDTSPERKTKSKSEPKAQDESEDKTKAAKRSHVEDNATVKPTIESDEEKSKPAALDDSDTDTKPAKEEEDSKMNIDEEEEYSDVIDEPPKPKRKKKEPKEPSSKPAKAPKKATTTSDDPDEAEIKKLQSYLIKCGVRKLWHNELKHYGDDSRAKIRHLKKMLADIGMDGRFSEAKAREIKEMRELMADAEAAQEMNELWGKGTGQRASRSKARSKNMKEDSDGSETEPMEGVKKQEDNDEDDDDEQDTFAARRRRAQADLAFLGDDSDSD